ncbi:MAG: YjfB family protein [Sulfuricella sp.]|nr:YjfB family protein [Sulfuricella sp.]
MDISSAATVSPLSGQAVGDSADSQVLKKALETGARTAAQTDETQHPAKPSSANLPPHLGQNVNTTA